MPTLNSHGSVTYGWAGGPAYRDSEPIGANAIGPWPFVVDALNSGQVCDASGCRVCSNATGLPTLVNVGADWIVAGGGRWASFHDFTLQDSARPGGIADQYPLAIDEDGWLATFNYRNGQTVIVTDINGSQRFVLDVGVLAVYGAAYRGGVLAFQQTGIGWALYYRDGLPVPFKRRTDGIYQCLPLWIDSRLWLVEANGVNTITLRKADEWTAYVLDSTPTGDKFHIDARDIFQEDRISVVWANNEGEPPGSLVRHDLTLAQILALPTMNTDPAILPPQPLPPSQGDIALPVPLISFPATWLGCTDGNSARPGNAEWSPSSYDDELDRPVGEGVDYAATVASRDLLIAKWSTEAAAGGLPALDRTILWAKQRKVAVEIHVDSPSHRLFAMEARQRVLDAGLVPVLCAHAVQNADDFEADARAFAALGKFGITLNFIAANKDPEQFKSCILRANGLHREFQPVVVWFARWQQAGPQMKAYCAEYCRLTPTPVKRPHEQGTQTPVPPIDIPPVSGPVMPNADPPVVKRKKRFRPS